MPPARWIAIAMFLISGGISIWWGTSIARAVPGGPLDFQAYYYSTKCLLQHKNPYNVTQLEALYRNEGGEHPSDSVQRRQTVTVCINLPSTFVFVAPFTNFSLGTAQVFWGFLAAAGLIASAFLIWEIAAPYSPIASGFLIAFLLANCELIFLTGNAVGIVISLCAFGVWCLVKERFIPLGTACMGLCLAIKPHDVGFVWLYFLLVGGVYRKRALKSLAIASAIGFAGLIWVSLTVPHWFQAWSANVAASSATGGVNSPGPLSMTINILGSVISLQTLFALLRDEPGFYNSLTYLLCGVMLIIWCVRTFRLGFARAKVWFALAAVAPITIIVTYHRSYDAKLLILTVPACAMLCAKGGAFSRMAFAVNLAAFVFAADFPLTILMIWARGFHVPVGGIFRQLGTIAIMRPAPLILFVMGIFYLWVYVRNTALSAGLATEKKDEGSGFTPIVRRIGENN